jgi:hypothetical protein
MKIFILFNIKRDGWLIYINQNIFLTILNKKKYIFNVSKNLNNYNYILKILRQFGLIKLIKNNKNY